MLLLRNSHFFTGVWLILVSLSCSTMSWAFYFKCPPSGSHYYPHEDCTMFIVCSNGYYSEFKCPPKTYWHQRVKSCRGNSSVCFKLTTQITESTTMADDLTSSYTLPTDRTEHTTSRIGTTEGEPGVGTTEGEPGFGTTEGEPGVGTTEGEPGVGTTEGEPGVGTTEGEPGVGTTEGEPGVGTTEREPGVGTTEGEPGVGTTKGEPGVGTTESEPGVGTTEGEPGVGTTEGEPGVGTTEGKPGVGTTEGEPEIGTTDSENGTTELSETENPFPCPPTGYHTLPHPADCSLYYRCYEGQMLGVYSCGSDLWFDSRSQLCVQPSQSDCAHDSINCES